MKREILFRGKRVDNGEWVEGFYFTTPLTDGKTDSKPEDGWFFLTGKTRHVISRNSCVYEVIPETVGQFTGLTDKNGKRIFEWDKLKTNYYSQYIVEDMIDFAVYCDDYIIGDSNTQTDMEVIGNIHDKKRSS